MDNRNQKNATKNQKNRNPQQPKRDVLPLPKPVRMEIHVPELPDEDDFVTIPLDEYAELISIATTMEIVERWAKSRNACSGGKYDELLLLMGAEEGAK
jgi:hypothetical protein